MLRTFSGLLFSLVAALTIASPCAARSIEPKSDLSFAAPTESVHYDERLLEAAEIAKLNARKYSHRRCWRAVKDALVEANVIPYRPTSRYAWQAADELENEFSFKKLDISDPYEAPLGSILVYGGPGAGHVEFRVEDGFVSDFTNPRPSHRPLIGVYVSSAAFDQDSPRHFRE